MNSTRRGLPASNLHRRIKPKNPPARVASRARKTAVEIRRPPNGKKPSDAALVTKSEKSRDSILEAAAKLFRRQGYSATTLRQIAGMAEIKAGSIYYYFDSKEAILDEVLEQGLQRIFEAVKIALKNGRQGLAPAPDRSGDRDASCRAAGGQRFHLREHSNLRSASRALEKSAPAAAARLCQILGSIVSGRPARRGNPRRYRDRSVANIRAGRPELDRRVVQLQQEGGGPEAGAANRTADLRWRDRKR